MTADFAAGKSRKESLRDKVMMHIDIAALTSKGQFTIPGRFRDLLRLSAGSKMIIVSDGEHLLLKPIRFTYHSDAENRLIAVEDKSGRVDVRDWRRFEFRYDYMGRQIGKKYYTWSKPNKDWMATPFKEVTFIYDGWNLIREDIKEHRSPTGGGGGKGKGQGGGGLPDAGEFTYSTNSYVWGLDLSGSLQGAGGIGGLLCMIPSSGGVANGRGGFFYTFDGNGNVSELLDPKSAIQNPQFIAAHYEYSPFGETIVSTGSEAQDNPFRFSTKYFDDESGLNYYGYRYYSPSLGRWLSRDPIGEDGGGVSISASTIGLVATSLEKGPNASEANFYLFADNSSINNYDYLGLQSSDCVCPPGSTRGKRHKPGYIPPVNGCTGVPDSFDGCSFTPACNSHDTCYGTCNSSKGTCDTNLGNDMRTACDQCADQRYGTQENWRKRIWRFRCYTVAQQYYYGVAVMGWPFYRIAQDKACECCYCP